MDYVLMVLLGLAIPVAWTAAFFMALGNRNRLKALENRFRALEYRLFGSGPAPGPMPYPPPYPAPPDAAVPDDLAPQWQSPPAAPTGAASPPMTEPVTATEPPSATDGPAWAGEREAVPPGPDVAADIPPALPPPAAPAASGPGLEEQLGTRWVVWVGGVALALGAIFLVRYSIEQGWIGPGVRIFLGALLAAALIAAGEWTRRREVLSGIAGLPQASIPAILTAAGTVAAYATVWSAYGLYGFIGPPVAFVLLGVVALTTLGAALLHGPALAGLGVVGAYVAPLLVSTAKPNFWALYIFLVIVTAAAFALARLRMWQWLAMVAMVASAAWALPALGAATLEGGLPHALYIVVVFALAAALLVSGLGYGPEPAPDTIDEVSSAVPIAYLAVATLLVIASDHATIPLAAFAALIAATVAIAWRAPAATGAVPVAALLAAVVIIEWAVQIRLDTLLAPGGPVARDAPAPSPAVVGPHLALGAAFAALFGGAGFLAQGRAERPVIPITWAVAALLAPIAILIALYYRVSGFERSIPFAGIALLLAALYATATELLSKREPRPGMPSAEALFAVGAVASLALALSMALEKGWLTVALALMAPGIAWIADKRPLPMLRLMAALCAVLVSLRVLWEPRIVGADVGTTPIFNWLLWGYGVPAVAFWTGAHLLRRRADDGPARMLDAAAILFTVLTLMLEIRHYVTGGNIYYRVATLAELGMQVSALLAVAIGLERVRGRTRNPVHDLGAIAVAALALIIALFGLLLGHNPLGTREPVGGLFVNLILLGYGLPAVLAIALALIAKGTRPMAYRAVAAASAVVMALMYLSLQVRRFYQGEVLSLYDPRNAPSDAELWTYSAVWLAFGVVLLLLGIVVRSQPARMASAVVILLTVLKVFLYDLAGIGGIWRSLSFIGLGAVLIGIGWMYQRLLFPKLPPGAGMPDGPGGEPPAGDGQSDGTASSDEARGTATS